MTFPPATSSVTPVVHDEPDDAKKSVAAAMFFGLTDSPKRKRCPERTALLFWHPRAHPVSLNRRRCDAIDSNTLVRTFTGKMAAESNHARFSRSVCSRHLGRLTSCCRSHGDNHAGVAGKHVRKERRDAEKRRGEVRSCGGSDLPRASSDHSNLANEIGVCGSRSRFGVCFGTGQSGFSLVIFSQTTGLIKYQQLEDVSRR
jgi:hypothetical protein